MTGSDEEIEALIGAVIDGQCDEAELRRFEDRIGADPRVRAAYVDQVRVAALLEVAPWPG